MNSSQSSHFVWQLVKYNL